MTPTAKVGQAKARSQEFHAGVPHESRGPRIRAVLVEVESPGLEPAPTWYTGITSDSGACYKTALNSHFFSSNISKE